MTDVTYVDGKPYDADQAAKIAVWVELTSELLAVAGIDDIREAIGRLARKADAQFPELSSGGSATLTTDDLGPSLAGVPENARSAFVFLTGDVLFLGIDGPSVSGKTLQEALTELTKR